MDTIELRGLTFRVELLPEDCMGPPWEEHDGHGAVRMTRDAKRPGERVLRAERGYSWLYDWQGAMAKAKAEGWGLVPEERAKLATRLGHEPTAGEMHAEAVFRDFEYCRRYIQDDWNWATVSVTLLDVDGEPTREQEAVGGIESDATSYHVEVARELAEEIARRVGRRKFIEHKATRQRIRK